ncbi:MAG: Type 1 glutamine amidotransferase-like domain-containing protein [Clostridia bacterium]|nr:Type 1 glutamine amidotransferase-like domain-containing protein [Clostridia bacterium]
MKIIYTSFLLQPKTRDNKLVVEPFQNENGIIDTLKNEIKNVNKMVFITNRWNSTTAKNQPKDEVHNDFHYTNNQYAKAVKECFKLSGINFKQMIVVDCKYNGVLKDDIKDADMVYIQGGHTPRGLKILKDIKFVDCIKKYKGVMIFNSTAAKLPATKALSTHHGNMKEYEIEEALCLKNYSIRPHFDYSLKEYLFDKKFRNRIKLIKDFSKHIDVYGLGGNSYILDKDNEFKIYGKCWLFKQGKLKKLQ